jgi:hypothetical protein
MEDAVPEPPVEPGAMEGLGPGQMAAQGGEGIPPTGFSKWEDAVPNGQIGRVPSGVALPQTRQKTSEQQSEPQDEA